MTSIDDNLSSINNDVKLHGDIKWQFLTLVQRWKIESNNKITRKSRELEIFRGNFRFLLFWVQISVVREKVSREIFLEIFLEQNFGEIIEKFLNKWKTIMNKKF